MKWMLAVVLFACGGDDSPPDPCAGIDCGAGDCVDDGAAARCDCDDGYHAQGLVCVADGGDSDVDTDSDTDCPDEDFDGHGAPACGDDCDDDDLTIHPGAVDNWPGWTKAMVHPANGPTAITSLGDDITIAFQSGDADALQADWSAGWKVADLWTFDDAGDWLDIDVEPGGDTHAVIYDQTHETFIYRTGGGGGSVERDRERLGEHCVIAVDDDGVAHFAYRDAAFTTIRVAWGVLGAFTAQEVVDDAVDSGSSTSIAVGDDGVTHVAYWAEGEILYAASPDWVAVPIEEGQDQGTSIAVDGAGAPHVTFSGFSSDLRHATLDGSWTSESIDGDGNTGFRSGAAFDASGALHIVYFSSSTTLLHATDSSGVWRIEEIDSSASDPSLAIGPDELRVSYRRDSSELWYASKPLPDGVDQDCDGVDGVDGDADTYASADTGGADCDDEDADVHPGAADPPGGADDDCDGSP